MGEDLPGILDCLFWSAPVLITLSSLATGCRFWGLNLTAIVLRQIIYRGSVSPAPDTTLSYPLLSAALNSLRV